MITEVKEGYTEESFSIAFVPEEIRLIMAGSIGYASILDRHGIRTAIIAGRIGEKMGLGQQDIDLLISASYMHDLGKMFIPMSILNKPASLDAREYEIVKAHPKTARQCLLSFDGYERIAHIVGQHHERIDGRGYPNRQTGERIDPLAKILAVADAYTAMTEDRPYQGAIAPIAAVERVRRVGGYQFDITVIEALLDCEFALPDIEKIIVIRGSGKGTEAAA